MKTPIPWKGHCFVHVRSDDLDDFYQLDGSAPGLTEARLRHQRSSGHWLASLNGVTAVRSREGTGPREPESDLARRALDAAAVALVARATEDGKFLHHLADEV